MARPDEEEDANSTVGGPRKKQKVEGPRPMCTNCEQCQLRKGKCDGSRPICAWCAANNKDCVYQEKKKPGLKPGYGRDLERRLTTLEETLRSREAELERKVIMLEERLESHSRILDQLRLSRPLPPLSSHGSSPVIVPHAESGVSAPSPAVSAYPSHHSSTSVAAQSPYPQPHYSQHPAAPMFASPGISSRGPMQQMNGSGLNHGSHGSMDVAKSSQHNLPPPTSLSVAAPWSQYCDRGLPPFDMAYDLIEVYFNHINPWFPLLDRRSSMDSLMRPEREEDKLLLHAIIATTIRFYDKSSGLQIPEYASQRQHYHDESKQIVLTKAFEPPTIKSLQALVILALDMIGSQNGGPGMFLLASIARSATQLGLTSESFSLQTSPDYPSISTLRASVLPEPRDFIEDESRRRLFWLIYWLDRMTTVATAFDFVLDESIIDRKLPCKDELFTANNPVDTRWFTTSRRTDYSVDYPANLGAFSYLIELEGLLTRIHQFLKRPVNINALADVEQWRGTYREIDVSLRNWRSNLPFEFRNIDQILGPADNGCPMSCSWILLQITYYTVFIRMHSSAAYPPYRTPIFTPSYSASQQCYQAVEKIVALAKYVIAHGTLAQQGPPFAFSLWVGARVLLVHGSTIEKHVSGEIHFLIQTLQQMGTYWPVAARYATILQRVMCEYQDSQQQAAAAAASGAIAPQPPSVTILADMRRCAYDLDTLISNEPVVRLMPNEYGAGVPGAGSIGPPLWQIGPRTTGNQSPVLNQLDYLETFNFFNYPRVGPAMSPADGAGFNAYFSAPSEAASHASMNGYGMSNVSSDWLSSHFA